MKSFHFLLIFLIYHFNLIICENGNFLRSFVKDFVKHENVPTIISVFDCHQQLSLFKIAKISNLPIASNPKMLLDDMLDPKKRRNDILTVVDLDCASARDILLALKPFHLAHPTRWLLVTESLSEFELQGVMESLPLRLDSYVILAEVINSANLSLKHVFKLNKQINHEDYGGWSPSGGISDIRPTRILSRRRANLHGTRLSAAVVLTKEDSKNHLNDQKDRHIDSISKVNYQLTNILLDKLNATREFKWYKSWGHKNQTTGKFEGYIGDLAYSNVDIGGTPLFMFPERLPYVEYLTLPFSSAMGFIFRAPPLSWVANIYYLPFNGMVWWSFISLLLLCTLTYFLTLRRPSNLKENKKWGNEMSDAAMVACGAVTQQGVDLKTRVPSSMISYYFLGLSMFFLYTSYTANIVALLQSTANSITTLKDLLESNLNLAVEDIVYNRAYFKIATEPVKKAIYETKIAPPGKKDKFIPQAEGIAKVRQGHFAFHAEYGPAYKLIEETFLEHEKCDLKEMKFLATSEAWYGITKHSPYKEIIKVSMLQIKESAVERREQYKIYTKKPQGCSSGSQSFGSVRFSDCYMVITVIISGYLAALSVLLLEYIVKRKKISLNLKFYQKFLVKKPKINFNIK
ncbi:uncharacterized protein DMENIID0001_087340 [Sergentomyia squamirostris]